MQRKPKEQVTYSPTDVYGPIKEGKLDTVARSELRTPGYEEVDHPKHYNEHPKGIECIDVIEDFPFNIGTSIKYLWRAGLKPGQGMVQDYKKALWYIQREIERFEKQS